MDQGHDDLGRDADLRGAESEFLTAARLEAEEAAREAAFLHLRSRDLSDAANELMNRGDLVTVTVGNRSFTGCVVHTAGDLVTLRTTEDAVEINLSVAPVIAVTERARSGGRSHSSGPGSFRGRLLELEGKPAVEVGLFWPTQAVLKGTIRVAAQDHLVLVDASGTERYVAIRWVAYVAGSSGAGSRRL